MGDNARTRGHRARKPVLIRRMVLQTSLYWGSKSRSRGYNSDQSLLKMRRFALVARDTA
jgi:hypothetical protein